MNKKKNEVEIHLMISRLNSNGFIANEICIQTTGITSACICDFRRTCGRSDRANVLGNAVPERPTNLGLLCSRCGVHKLFYSRQSYLSRSSNLPLSSEATFHPNLVEIHGFKIQ